MNLLNFTDFMAKSLEKCSHRRDSHIPTFRKLWIKSITVLSYTNLVILDFLTFISSKYQIICEFSSNRYATCSEFSPWAFFV